MGAQVLAKLLRASGSTAELFALVAEPLAREDAAVRALNSVGFTVLAVPLIENPNGDLEREWFASTYTKLHVWNLTQCREVVYLDSDVLVVRKLDVLFERRLGALGVAAAPDLLPPDKLQSGVLRLRPDAEVFEDMLAKVGQLHSYDGGDQGFLNAYFPGWYEGELWTTRLPFAFNCLASMAHLYPPAWRLLERKAEEDGGCHVVHFSGDPERKPWFPGQQVIVPPLARYVHLWQVVAKLVQQYGGSGWEVDWDWVQEVAGDVDSANDGERLAEWFSPQGVQRAMQLAVADESGRRVEL